MVISNGLAKSAELHYTHSLHPKEPFFGYKGKKKKKRERATGGASEPNILLTYNHRLWYALFPLYEVHRYNYITCIPSYASDSEASLNIFSLRGMGQKTPKHLHFSKGLEYWLF